jgi:hypothetical protein
VLAVFTCTLIPGVSYLFVLPALLGSLVALVRRRVWALPAVSLVSLVVAVPIVDILFQLAQPRPGNPDSEMIPVAGAAAAIAFLVIGLISATWPEPGPHHRRPLQGARTRENRLVSES